MELRIPEDELRNAYEVFRVNATIEAYHQMLEPMTDYNTCLEPFSTYSFLEYFGEKLGVQILFKDTGDADSYAYYEPFDSKIVYGRFGLSIIFHEIAHAIHDTFEDLYWMPNKAREIVAEFSAYVLSNYLGNNQNNSANMIYILAHANGGYQDLTLQSIDKAKAIIEQYSDDILRICNTAIQWLQEAGEQHS